MEFKKVFKITMLTVFAFVLAISASAAFEKKLSYENSFSDISENAWYAKEVSSAYELGFVEGVSETLYSPDSTVTVAQGITMASRVHAEYNGKTIAQVEGGKWYDAYVNYALENGIITKNQFDDYTRNLKRIEMAELFHDAMGKDYYRQINDIVFIPDVELGTMSMDKLLTMYNAGIVTGNDKYGSFAPNSSIKRSECAAIINRVAIPENRKTFEPLPFTSGEAYQLCYNVGMSSAVEGIASGWTLDNRGGNAKVAHTGFGTLGDISTKYGSAYIREFNYICAGKIVLEAIITAQDNGTYIAFKDIEGNDTYNLKIVDGKWSVLNPDGKYLTGAQASGKSCFRIVVDLGTGMSETFVDDVNCGVTKLLSDNVLSLYIGVDEKGTGSLTVNEVNATVNYAAYENFDIFDAASVYGWETAGDVKTSSKQLTISANSSAKKSFAAIDGTSITQFYVISRDAKDYTMNFGDALKLEIKDSKLMAGNKELYTMTRNMWYRFRVDVNSTQNTAKIYLNGRVIANVSLDQSKNVDYFKIASTGFVMIDNLKVYKEVIPEDYVSAPTTRANLDDYITVMNICSLWKNGDPKAYGWACITPYDEPSPLIGYYDEGTPETADWEIKFMVEHGVDVQAFCWYNDVSSGPIKQTQHSEHLNEGYMYAKYSDYMHYMLQWEVGATDGTTKEQFRNYVVPYWFENYFLDDRYLKIENKLVLGVYSYGSLSGTKYFGSAEKAKAEFDYLDEKAKEYGFDGVILLASGTTPTSTMEKMGFDGQYAYSWDKAGKSASVNIKNITAQADKKTSVYGIPTISTGFDSLPWHGTRIGFITKEEHMSVLEWVKNTHLPSIQNKPSWAERFVWISTWNEFGEGTYVMPGGQNGDGFGYLDNIRDVLTELPENHSHNLPTAHQAERINHLYPQYARLLRREGWYDFNKTEADKKKESQSKLYINDQDILAIGDPNYYIPAVTENGKTYYPFNPINAVNYILGCHYEWRKDAGTLKIVANGHEVMFEVGSDVYKKDGNRYELGYTVETLDGVPRLDFVLLAKDLGYKVEEKDGNVYIFTDTYEETWKKLSEKKLGSWEFNLNDSEGWSSTHMDIVVADGSAVMTTNGSNDNDPRVDWNMGSFPDGFYTKKFTHLEIRARYEKMSGGYASQMFFATDVDDSYNEAKAINFYWSGEQGGDWVTATVDLRNIEGWKNANYLVGLRFDPLSCPGQIEFDYIRFIEDPDFVYVEPVKEEFSIKNGDAEGTEMKFGSGNAKISIIEEPGNKKNHVYSVEAGEGAPFVLFDHAAEFEAGETYFIEYDIKLVGTNNQTSSEKSTGFVTNLIYPDIKNSSSGDHLVRETTTPMMLTVGDDWTHYTAVHTVKNVDNQRKHTFRITVDPSNGVGFNFYVDNISVRKLSYEEKLKRDPAAFFSWEQSNGIRFSFDNSLDGWSLDGMTQKGFENGALVAEALHNDPKIVLSGLKIDTEKCVAVAIKYKAENNILTEIGTEAFFMTDNDKDFTQAKNCYVQGPKLVDEGDGYYTAIYNFGANELWDGTVTSIRIDPANAVTTFTIDEIMIIEC